MKTLIDLIKREEKQLIEFQKRNLEISIRMLFRIKMLKVKLATERLAKTVQELIKIDSGNRCIVVEISHNNQIDKKVYLYEKHKKEVKLIQQHGLSTDIQNWYDTILIEIE